LIHPAVWPQQTWAEIWGLCPLGVELGPEADLGMFSMFGRTGAPQKGVPQEDMGRK